MPVCFMRADEDSSIIITNWIRVFITPVIPPPRIPIAVPATPAFLICCTIETALCTLSVLCLPYTSVMPAMLIPRPLYPSLRSLSCCFFFSPVVRLSFWVFSFSSSAEISSILLAMVSLFASVFARSWSISFCSKSILSLVCCIRVSRNFCSLSS